LLVGGRRLYFPYMSDISYTAHETLAAANELRPVIRAALRRAIDAVKAADPREVVVSFEGVSVRIGIGSYRPAIGAPKIFVSSLATLRYPTNRLVDALARGAGLG
jgi:hypothetical protein